MKNSSNSKDESPCCVLLGIPDARRANSPSTNSQSDAVEYVTQAGIQYMMLYWFELIDSERKW